MSRMATVLIDPIATQTRGGYFAEVTGVDPTHHDCLIGTIEFAALGKIAVKWNDLGICRDRADACNLDMKRPEVSDVVKTANELRA